MATPEELAFPPGHPARHDYDPDSPEAVEWRRKHVHPKGERDFPVDHPKAIDTPGNDCGITWTAGVDPFHPELEPWTGRDPETAKRHREVMAELTRKALESPALVPVEAPPPPPPGDISIPTGQPGR